jgi:hypothetical protein
VEERAFLVVMRWQAIAKDVRAEIINVFAIVLHALFVKCFQFFLIIVSVLPLPFLLFSLLFLLFLFLNHHPFPFLFHFTHYCSSVTLNLFTTQYCDVIRAKGR